MAGRSVWFFWPLTCLLLLAFRPIADCDFWWTLARGRAALSGVAATDTLFRLPGAAAAHWADGVVWFVLWDFGDLLLLQWTPAVAGFTVLWWLGIFSQTPSALRFLLPCLLLILLRPALQPSPMLNALFCLLLLDSAVRLQTTRLRLCVAVGLIMLLWANTAVLPIWGVFPLLLQFHRLQSSGIQAGQSRLKGSPLRPVIAVAGLATCLNPRGPLVFVDSLRQLAAAVHPVWHSWQAAIAADGPVAAVQPSATAASAHFLVFLGLTMTVGLQRPAQLSKVLFSAVLLITAALLNPEHLPLCALSVVLLSNQSASSPDVTRKTFSSPVVDSGRVASVVIAMLLTGCMLADAAGWGPFSVSRIGWGLDQTLDSRLLDLPSVSMADRPVIWAADRRTAGLAAWRNDAVQLVDHPLTAFRTGRLAEHLRVLRDLRSGHRASFRLPDGTAGGWYRKLQQWQVTMLLTPVECFSLNAALQRSTWKLADLDSPNLPWLTAETVESGPLIQQLAAQQNFVQWGSWRPDANVYDAAGVRVDLCELAGGGVDVQPALRQVALFRSQKLPLAAIRALLPVRTQRSWLSSGAQQVLEAVRDCERDLAEMEWDNYGVPGLWRRRLLLRLNSDIRRSPTAFPWDAELASATGSMDSKFEEMLAASAAGQLDAALRITADGTPEMRLEKHYARAMLLLELGKVPQAREELRQLLDDQSLTQVVDHQFTALRLASRGWLELTGAQGGEQP